MESSSKKSHKICFVCQHPDWKKTSDYEECLNCHHELLALPATQTYMTNDILDSSNFHQTNALDSFKSKVLKRFMMNHSCLADIGSGSGKFLFQNRHLFKDSIGVEVTPACITFSREHGLIITERIDSINQDISVATFWHSLEHMPIQTILEIMASLSQKNGPALRVIISVPNNSSLLYLFAGKRFAYYDVPNHIHQFSKKSLTLLMKQFGFAETASLFSFAYSSFGYLQTLLNFFNPIHNYFYYRKKRGCTFNKASPFLILFDGLNLLLIPFLLVPALIGSFFDLFFKQQAGVITQCYKKTASI